MGGFTHKQVEWIRERDNYKCQFPGKHICDGDIEIHHIRPQGYCLVVHQIPEERFNVPTNAIALCRRAHQTLVHPDTDLALRAYRNGNKKAFEELQQNRHEVCAKHQRYWVDTWDNEMFAIAKQRTEMFLAKGRIWPLKKGAK